MTTAKKSPDPSVAPAASTRRASHPRWRSLAAALACFAMVSAASAGPGAHGPNGEHLDAPAATGPAGPALPRVESFSELFELVARLTPEALVVDLARYASNEPVAAAKLEVESGGAQALAAFDPVTGSYRVTDAAFLKTVAAPGSHALVFTVTAGQDADLLEGTLSIASPAAEHGAAHADDHAHDHAHAWPASVWPMAGAAVFAAGVGWFAWRRKAQRRRNFA